jgi:predicted transcriptional regulator
MTYVLYSLEVLQNSEFITKLRSGNLILQSSQMNQDIELLKLSAETTLTSWRIKFRNTK